MAEYAKMVCDARHGHVEDNCRLVFYDSGQWEYRSADNSTTGKTPERTVEVLLARLARLTEISDERPAPLYSAAGMWTVTVFVHNIPIRSCIGPLLPASLSDFGEADALLEKALGLHRPIFTLRS